MRGILTAFLAGLFVFTVAARAEDWTPDNGCAPLFKWSNGHDDHGSFSAPITAGQHLLLDDVELSGESTGGTVIKNDSMKMDLESLYEGFGQSISTWIVTVQLDYELSSIESMVEVEAFIRFEYPGWMGIPRVDYFPFPDICNVSGPGSGTITCLGGAQEFSFPTIGYFQYAEFEFGITLLASAPEGEYASITVNSVDMAVDLYGFLSCFCRVMGDLNADCKVLIDDIPLFVEYLIEGKMLTEDCSACRADINPDGRLDANDIEPFVAALLIDWPCD